VFNGVRGLGLMLGIELAAGVNPPGDTSKTAAVRFVSLLHTTGLLAIPAGAQVIRLLPPLNLRASEAEEGLAILRLVAGRLAA
jgi:acetylornithine/succinyldiaminopimelate/putrescine aminotransferase